MNHWGKMEKAIETAPLSYLPALFLLILHRCIKEKVFKGPDVVCNIITAAYREGGR